MRVTILYFRLLLVNVMHIHVIYLVGRGNVPVRDNKHDVRRSCSIGRTEAGLIAHVK